MNLLQLRAYFISSFKTIVSVFIELCLQNALFLQEQQKSMVEIQNSMGYEHLDNIYPTGIKSNLWHSLKNMPSILYHIEKWLNIIDLQQELFTNNNDDEKEYKEANEMVSNSSSCIDLTLLYHALHRAKESSNNNYKIYNILGAFVLKFMSILYAFSTDPKSDAAKLHKFEKIIMQKTSIKHKLSKCAKKLNIEGYSIFHDFKWNRWNPPSFEYRLKDSLYDSGTFKDVAKDGYNAHLRAYLLQSVIGAFWASIMNQPNDNPMSHAINATFKFLKQLEVLPDDYHVMKEFNNLKDLNLNSDNGMLQFINKEEIKCKLLLSKWGLPEYLYDNLRINSCGDVRSWGMIDSRLLPMMYFEASHVKLFKLRTSDNRHLQQYESLSKELEQNITNLKTFISDEPQSNILLNACLITIITHYDGLQKYGITFDKLEILGDAVLDLLTVWHIYCNICDDQFNKQIGDKSKKAAWGHYIKDIRDMFVNDNWLGYLLAANGLHNSISFYNSQEITKYVKEMIAKETEMKLNENEQTPYNEMMENQKSPGGWIKERNGNNWPLQIEAPNILGRTFESLLGAIFLGENYGIFLSSHQDKSNTWNFAHCVSYLDKFLAEKNDDWNDFNWYEWIGKVNYIKQ